MKTKDAFPSCSATGDGPHGLSDREYFAAKAMQGMLSNPQVIDVLDNFTVGAVSKYAVEMADALIAALNEEKKS